MIFEYLIRNHENLAKRETIRMIECPCNAFFSPEDSLSEERCDDCELKLAPRVPVDFAAKEESVAEIQKKLFG